MRQLRVIVSSTRPTRVSPTIAQWVAEQANPNEWNVELLDLAELNLPFLDEPQPPRYGNYQHEHTKMWAAKVDEADAIVIVMPEYNAAYPAPLKNAIDMLFAEWNGMPVGIIGYGHGGAARATKALSPVLANVQADERAVINMRFGADLDTDGIITNEAMADEVRTLISKLV